MKIELTNGSIFQIIGTDKYDAVRGTNPIGCVFSEYAFQNPLAWDVVRPILTQNKGWAVFNTTPNGKNHCFDLYKSVKDDSKWFTEVLTIDDTDCIDKEDVDLERKSGMTEDMIEQEFYCSFDIGTRGSYYSDQMAQIREEERIATLPF